MRSCVWLLRFDLYPIGIVALSPRLLNCLPKLLPPHLSTFHPTGYQSSEGTAKGTEASRAYNQVIREGTLEYGYLDHFKQVHSRQLSPWIIPGVVETWTETGRKTAEKWVEECPTESSKTKMRGQIAAIDEAVQKVQTAVAAGDAQAIGAAGSTSMLSGGLKAFFGIRG